MKEKTSKLEIVTPKLSKIDLMKQMDCEAIQTNYCRVSFKKTVLGNRCPPTIIDDIISYIKPEAIHNWKFDYNGGGVLYKEALQKAEKEIGFTEIRIPGKTKTRYIYVTSVEKEYLDHDKKVRLWAERLRRKGIIVFPVACSETDDTCKVPKKEYFLKSIGIHTLNKEKEA